MDDFHKTLNKAMQDPESREMWEADILHEERVEIAKKMLEPDYEYIAKITGLEPLEVKKIYLYEVGIRRGEAIGYFEFVIRMVQVYREDGYDELKEKFGFTNWEIERAKSCIFSPEEIERIRRRKS